MRYLAMLAGLVLTAPFSVGATLTYTPSVTFDGTLYTYSYAVSYQADGVEAVYQISLEALAGLVNDLAAVGAPADWTAVPDFTGNSITWISSDYSFDIFNSTLTGFWFRSTVGPGTVSHTALLEDDQLNALGTLSGSVTGPSAVPEPTGLVFGGLVMLLLARGRWTRLRLVAASCVAVVGLAAAPTVSVKVAGSPTWAPDISIRAGQAAGLDASASTGSGPLSFSWTQVAGPNQLRWARRNTSQPQVTGAIFGTYVVRVTVADLTGSASAELRFGAVPSDAAGVVTPQSQDVAVLFAPMIRWGASAWPWIDERHRALADGFAQMIVTDPNVNGVDVNTALAGTAQVTFASSSVTGTGTQFQTDFCNGGTSGVAGRAIVFWYPVPGVPGKTGRRAYGVASCPSQTTLVLSGAFEAVPGAHTVQFGHSRCTPCWGGNSPSPVNYYDNAMAFYSLYYRSGRTEYRDAGRRMAEHWYRGYYLDEGRTWVVYSGRGGAVPIKRLGNLLGVIWWAYETNQPDVIRSLYPALDQYAALFNAAGELSDPREDGFAYGYLAMGARFAPDASKRSQYMAALGNGLTLKWVPLMNPAGWYTGQTFVASPGRANVTQGSDLVTFSGVTITSAMMNNWFWVSNTANASSGDAEAYLFPAFVNSSTLRLPRAYTGATRTNQYYQLEQLVGRGVQPFFQGIAARMLELAYRVSGDIRARNLVLAVTDWLRREGIQSSTRGLYYGRVFPNCEPIQDALFGCSYNAGDPQRVIDSRYLTPGTGMAFSTAYAAGGGGALLAAGDSIVSAAMGKLGGPGTDGIYADPLDYSLNVRGFKDFGYFFGTGMVQAWPAARTGTATSKMLGR